MLRIVLVALLLVVVAVGCGEAGSSGAKTYDAYPAMDIPAGEPWVIVATNLGRMTFTLFPDEAPLAVNNFLFLANEGYFDGVGFHRLIPGFMVQGGDPSGTGTGGPGYKFEIELPQRPYIRGGLAMANSGVPTPTARSSSSSSTTSRRRTGCRRTSRSSASSRKATNRRLTPWRRSKRCRSAPGLTGKRRCPSRRSRFPRQQPARRSTAPARERPGSPAGREGSVVTWRAQPLASESRTDVN